jgi:hypothetical protein
LCGRARDRHILPQFSQGGLQDFQKQSVVRFRKRLLCSFFSMNLAESPVNVSFASWRAQAGEIFDLPDDSRDARESRLQQIFES